MVYLCPAGPTATTGYTRAAHSVNGRYLMYRRTQDDPVLKEVDAMVNVNLTKPIILAVKILFFIGVHTTYS
jgi:hypothetical protein